MKADGASARNGALLSPAIDRAAEPIAADSSRALYVPRATVRPLRPQRRSPLQGIGRGDLARPATPRDAIYRRTLASADVLAAGLSLILTAALVGPDQPAMASLCAAPLIVVLAKFLGIYDREEFVVRKSTLDEAPALFQLAMLYVLIIWLINGFLITQTSNRRELIVHWLVVFPLLLLFRTLGRSLAMRVSAPERCLVVGSGPACDRIRDKLAAHEHMHGTVVAQVELTAVQAEHEKLDTLSDEASLKAIVADFRIERIIIAPESAETDDVLNVIRAASTLGVRVSVVPRLLEVVGSSVEFDEIEGIPLLSMRSVRLSRSSRALKRTMDLTAAFFGLALTSPLLIAFAAAIRLESRGPILFRQLRVGRDGKAFEMLKFRTMVNGAHEQREALRHLNEADGLFKIRIDPRVTRVGAILRALSLDELPQLWNVIRGDMSIVGPRPLVIDEDSLIRGFHRRRLQLTPGMTGPWQILGSARVPLREMVNIDYLYVVNWSLWNDVKILLRTIPYVIARKGM